MILFGVILLLALTIIMYHKIRLHICELCRYKCAEIVNRMITDVVSEIGDRDNTYYRIEYDDQGKIVSALADSQALNRLQNDLRAGLNERLSQNGYDSVTLTVGDISDIEIFSGKGAELSFGFQQTGKVDTELLSSFDSAGINQTRFRASVRITVEFRAMLPSGSEVITVEQEYVAADAVIVGEIPDIYPFTSLGA